MKTIRALLTLFLILCPTVRAAETNAVTTFFTANDPDQSMKIDHAIWKQILTRYIRATPDGVNLFAYGEVNAADRKGLKDYLASLQATEISGFPRDEQMAFWINLYNAQTIDVVLDHYPVKSIKDISLGGGFFSSGPWKKQVMTVEGQ